jgi:hypothetical protein
MFPVDLALPLAWFILLGVGWYGGVSTPTIVQDSTASSITNSVAPTTLATLIVPGNSIGPAGVLELFVWLRFLNNTGVNRNVPIISINLGGVQIGGISNLGPCPTNATPCGYYCHIWLKNLNVANLQSVLSWNVVSNAMTQFTGQFPDVIDAVNQRSVAVDTTQSQTLTVIATNSVADPNVTTFYDGLEVKGT